MDLNFDIPRIGGDLAPASRNRIRNAYATGVCLSYKNLIGKQTARNISRICFYKNLDSVATFKFHITRTPMDRNLFCGNNTIQKDITCAST